ncbi:MAG: hypothetical protein WBE54_13630, partial [Bradyrhizobium sp.]
SHPDHHGKTVMRPYSALAALFSIRRAANASMIGAIIKFSVSLAAVAASLLATSWIGLALLGF